MGFLESACATLDSWNNPRHVPKFHLDALLLRKKHVYRALYYPYDRLTRFDRYARAKIRYVVSDKE